MRVLLVTGEYPPMQGGVGDYTHELGVALGELGAEVHVLTSQAAQGDHPGPPSSSAEPRVHARVPRWGWRTWGVLREMIRGLRPDVVHVQYQAAAYGLHPALNLMPYGLLRQGLPARLAVTFHDLRVPYLFPKAGPLRRWAVLRLARIADLAVATNTADFQELRMSGGVRRLELIPIGSNIRGQPPPGYDRAAWRARLGLDAGDVLLGYFGFLNASKGGETLIRALAELVRRGVPARLLMIGGQVGASDPTNAAYLQRVRALIDRLGMAARVHWTGYVSQAEVSGHLLAVDVCVLPYQDGASFRRGSLMAALAHGLPIVTTRPPREYPEPEPPGRSMPRLIDGGNVLLVPPEDPLAIADAVQRLLAAPALRATLAREARRLAEAFRWDGIAARHLEVYGALGVG